MVSEGAEPGQEFPWEKLGLEHVVELEEPAALLAPPGGCTSAGEDQSCCLSQGLVTPPVRLQPTPLGDPVVPGVPWLCQLEEAYSFPLTASVDMLACNGHCGWWTHVQMGTVMEHSSFSGSVGDGFQVILRPPGYPNPRRQVLHAKERGPSMHALSCTLNPGDLNI